MATAPTVTERDGQSQVSPADTPAEAAIVQDMRESGMLPRWEIKDIPPESRQPVRHISLTLAGGLRLTADDQFHGRIVCCLVPSSVASFPWDTPLETIARELPAKLLPVLREALPDLEQIVAAESGTDMAAYADKLLAGPRATKE